jgi:hypothetical protein
MPEPADLLARLDSCPLGIGGWKQFEDVGVDILKYLFVPPLAEPQIQARSFSGIDRRDAIFPNRNMAPDTYWGLLNIELKARMVLVEFKNYDIQELGKEEVDQTRNYLTKPMGRLAIICCRKEPAKEALLRRNHAYTQEGKVIIFVTEDKLREMMHMKERGDDPSRLVVEMVELFYSQHE